MPHIQGQFLSSYKFLCSWLLALIPLPCLIPVCLSSSIFSQMTGISIPHGYANLDIERGATQNGNPTSSAPLSYELHSLQADATLGSSEQPIFVTMVQDGYSSAICDNSDAVTFAPDGRNARDGFVVVLGYGSQHVWTYGVGLLFREDLIIFLFCLTPVYVRVICILVM